MLENIAVLCLLVYGVYVVTRKGSLLGIWETLVVERYAKKYPDTYWHHLAPFTECTCCMNSFWGISMFYYLGQVDQLVYFTFVGAYLCLGMLAWWEEIIRSALRGGQNEPLDNDKGVHFDPLTCHHGSDACMLLCTICDYSLLWLQGLAGCCLGYSLLFWAFLPDKQGIKKLRA